MIARFKGTLLALLALAAAAACETQLPEQDFPALTYGHLGVFRLDVGELRVVSEYAPPMKAPNVDHLFPTSPEKGLRRWATDRLVAAGAKGTARFVIVDAAVIETPLEIESGLGGLFTTQQSVRYEARAEAMLEILDNRGYRKGFASARVSRARTLGEDATIDERRRLWFELTEALIIDFNAEIEKNIRQFMSGYLF